MNDQIDAARFRAETDPGASLTAGGTIDGAGTGAPHDRPGCHDGEIVTTLGRGGRGEAVEPVELRTAHLSMRPLTLAHLDDMLDLYRDPAVTRFLAPLDEDGHRRRLEEAEASWASRGHGRVAVFQRSSGAFLGRSGLQYWPAFDEVEVGWAFRSEAWGRGYATEAGGAWIRWGLDHLEVPYITANIHPENTASLAVAERLGMEVLREDTFHDMPAVVYATVRNPTADR